MEFSYVSAKLPPPDVGICSTIILSHFGVFVKSGAGVSRKIVFVMNWVTARTDAAPFAIRHCAEIYPNQRICVKKCEKIVKKSKILFT